MRKYKLIIFMCILMVLCIAGCSKDKTEKGILEIAGHTCYKIYLGEERVEDYFSLEGTAGKVTLSFNGQGGLSGSVADYSEISEGGWVAYVGPYVIYLPEGVSKESVQIACSFLQDIKSDNCLTIDEVQEYLPWLK